MDFEQVRNVIAETLGCEAEEVTETANLMEDLGADSLAAAELHMALEDATGITIEDGAMANLKTAGDILEYLNAHKA